MRNADIPFVPVLESAPIALHEATGAFLWPGTVLPIEGVGPKHRPLWPETLIF
jgi:hypothetical protein